VDIFSCAFQVEKKRQDSGLMLLKHNKYSGFCDISRFGRISLFLRFWLALGSHFGRFWRPLGTIFGFCRGPKKRSIFLVHFRRQSGRTESATIVGRGVWVPKRTVERPQTAASRPTVSRPQTRGPED